MRHLLSDPFFPDIIGEWAAQRTPSTPGLKGGANDNHSEREQTAEMLLARAAKAEIEATRVW